MKKSYLLIVALFVNSVSVKAVDSEDILGRVAVTAATLALGHVLYSQEKDGAEQRAKGHVFTPTSGKDGRIAIPGEDILVRKAMDNACELPAHVITLPIRLIVSPFEICARTGFCTEETYESVLEYTIDKTMPVSGYLLIASLLATAPLLVINDWIFKTPTEKFKAEYIAANPSEYLKQVKANHAWFSKDLDKNISDKDTVRLGSDHCSKLDHKKRTTQEKIFCSDMSDLKLCMVKAKKS